MELKLTEDRVEAMHRACDIPEWRRAFSANKEVYWVLDLCRDWLTLTARVSELEAKDVGDCDCEDCSWARAALAAARKEA